MVDRAIGLDVSFWQDYDGTEQKIDFNKAKSNGAQFVIVKSSQDLFVDEDFEYNIISAKKAGLITGMYHFWDYRKSATDQAKYFASLCLKHKPDLPPVLDFEQRQTWPMPTPANTIRAIQIFMDVFEQAYGKKMMFYTNPNMIKNFLTYDRIPSWLLEHDLWIASYPRVMTDTSAPVFQPWSNWKFWQYSDKGDGIAYGMESKQVDMNYFNGTYEELKKYAGIKDEPTDPTPPVDGEDMSEYILRLTNVERGLVETNKRIDSLIEILTSHYKESSEDMDAIVQLLAQIDSQEV